MRLSCPSQDLPQCHCFNHPLTQYFSATPIACLQDKIQILYSELRALHRPYPNVPTLSLTTPSAVIRLAFSVPQQSHFPCLCHFSLLACPHSFLCLNSLQTLFRITLLPSRLPLTSIVHACVSHLSLSLSLLFLVSLGLSHF